MTSSGTETEEKVDNFDSEQNLEINSILLKLKYLGWKMWVDRQVGWSERHHTTQSEDTFILW